MSDTINFAGIRFERRQPKRSSTIPGVGGLDYMRPKGPQTHITENYVSTPPALTVTDETGAIWSLGFNTELSRGEYAYDVLRNGFKVGEKANRIERRGSRISIFGPEGRKVWNGRTFI